MDNVPDARADEVAVRVVWAPDGGRVTGHVEIRNRSGRTVRLDGKPGISPLGLDGAPLQTQCVVTAELRMPSYVDLEPEQLATASIGWAGWNGPPASGQVLVSWGPGGEAHTARVDVAGPAQPASTGPSTNLWSSWFVPSGP